MIRLAADEDLDNDILRALRRRLPTPLAERARLSTNRALHRP